MQKILIATSAHVWFDTRIFYKQAQTLAENYHVELHAPAPFRERIRGNIRVQGLPEWTNTEWTSRIIRLKTMLKIFYRSLRSDAKLVHYHDAELLPVGLAVKLLSAKYVIFDSHEIYELKIIKRDWIPRVVRKSLVMLYKLFEKMGDHFFDGIIGVIDDQKTTFHNTNFALIKNYPIITDRNYSTKSINSETNLVYIGDITNEREIHKFIPPLVKLSDNQKVNLHLIGPVKNPLYKKDLESRINNLNLTNQVKLHGYIPIDEAMNLLKTCDIGLLPFRHPSNFMRAFPVKLFDYMAAGLAVVMPRYPLSGAIIKKAGCGVFVDSTDETDVVAKIQYLIDHPTITKRMGKRGLQYARNHYSWNSQAEKLLSLYQRVLSSAE